MRKRKNEYRLPPKDLLFKMLELNEDMIGIISNRYGPASKEEIEDQKKAMRNTSVIARLPPLTIRKNSISPLNINRRYLDNHSRFSDLYINRNRKNGSVKSLKKKARNNRLKPLAIFQI